MSTAQLAEQKSRIAERRTRVLGGAIKRLRRLSNRRASKDVKQAYREAAEMIKKVAK